MRRRPAASLVPVPLARLAGYALLATVGSLQWVRYVDGASSARAVAWAAAGTVTGALVIAGRRRAWTLVGAALIGALLALAASGLDLSYLEPKHLDELGDGLGRGATALNTVRLPYLGREPWVLTTVQLSGAAICWLAALGALWPTGGGARVGALILLLTLSASPVISLGADRPALLGVALAVLTAAFLWLERLARRPGLGAIALGATVFAAAVPLGIAADREEPWFDYKAFSEKLSGGVPITFSWNHDYGPIDWTRDGTELFRVRSKRPYYWKTEVLQTFEDNRWTSAVRDDPGGEDPVDDLPAGRRNGFRPAGVASSSSGRRQVTFSVALRRLKTPTVVGAGTVLAVSDATVPVEPNLVPGTWIVSDGKTLSKGDSYTVRASVPRPSPDQLQAATVGRDDRRAADLTLRLDIRPDRVAHTPSAIAPVSGDEIHQDSAEVTFGPYESGRPPRAEYGEIGVTAGGASALRNSYYARTWAKVRSLRADAASPYDFLLRVNAFLRSDGFSYTEKPEPAPRDEAPLDYFLFESKQGYCQQFSGAMALMLRMGGVPARVVSGFSPGGLRASSGEWVVRDTDAHSWVEAWFDGIGWVTFDPTPPATPARSQIAAIDPPRPEDAIGAGDDAAPPRIDRRPQGPERNQPAAPSAGGGAGDDGSAWPWLGAGAVLALAILAAGTLLRRRQAELTTPEAALAELERALRRSGRPAPAGTTLSELERRLGTASGGYLRALRAARYRANAPRPSPEQRAAFRRELAAGLGWGGRLRSYYALPPTLPTRRPR